MTDPPFSAAGMLSTTADEMNNNSDNYNRKKRARDNSGTKHPVYRGVRMRSWGRWVSEIRQPRMKSRIWLGTFPTAEMAARAHDAAAMSIKGDSATLNFPHLRDSLPRPASLAPRDVQAAAAKAAAMEIEELSPPSSSLSEEEEEECLGEIIELPRLEGSHESSESGMEFTAAGAAEEWLQPPWWEAESDFNEYFYDEAVGWWCEFDPCNIEIPTMN